ncbi:MAG: hypothetical protein R6W89_06195, partial [Candidatus Hydrogenedentota bacterium]
MSIFFFGLRFRLRSGFRLGGDMIASLVVCELLHTPSVPRRRSQGKPTPPDELFPKPQFATLRPAPALLCARFNRKGVRRILESPKRIAMVAYTFYDSDPRVRRHVAALVNAGYAVDLYCLVPRNGDTEGDNEQVRIFHLQERTYDRSGKLAIILDYVKFAFRCAGRLLKNHFRGARYALIHINNMPNFLLVSALPLRLMGVG